MCMNEAKYQYIIVSKAAYLLGVPKRIFDNEYESPLREVFDEFSQNEDAQKVRLLCMLRTYIERNYKDINYLFCTDIRNLNTLNDEYIDEILEKLSELGTNIIQCNYKLDRYIIDINKLISENISKCRDVFPDVLEWKYIKALFVMPNGLSENGIKSEAKKYYQNLESYPYQVYMGTLFENKGNILLNDEKFIRLLYAVNHDEFSDFDKLPYSCEDCRQDLENFILSHSDTVIAIDTENSDPYKTENMINFLISKDLMSKISHIIMVNDINTSVAWNYIADRYPEKIENHITERVKKEKSLVDMELSVKICEEHLYNKKNSFILMSSDSDYYAVIKNLPRAEFFVMVERSKCSETTVGIFSENNVSYGILDDFAKEESTLMRTVLNDGIKKHLMSVIGNINIKKIFSSVCFEAYTNLSKCELEVFFDKYIKNMKIAFNISGEPFIVSE